MNPLISVVIPFYNNENTIVRALKSVIDQTYSNIEIILIDDGSKDKSNSIVKNFIKKECGDLNIVLLEQQNCGPSVARNKGINSSKGEFIAFLDADDSWVKDKLEIQIRAMLENDIDILGCNFYIDDGKKKEKHYFVKNSIEKIGFKKMLYKHYYATPCVLCRKETLYSCGLFKEDQKYMEDSLLFTKICREYNAYMINDFLVNTFKNPFGESGLSGNILEMQKYELKNFKVLYKENKTSKNKLTILEFISINIFSIVKFIRRILLVNLIRSRCN
ncbi:glycosyltransferase family 2 protein [Clostridium perfringens]